MHSSHSGSMESALMNSVLLMQHY